MTNLLVTLMICLIIAMTMAVVLQRRIAILEYKAEKLQAELNEYMKHTNHVLKECESLRERVSRLDHYKFGSVPTLFDIFDELKSSRSPAGDTAVQPEHGPPAA